MGLLTETRHFLGPGGGGGACSRKGCSQKPVTFVNAWGGAGAVEGLLTETRHFCNSSGGLRSVPEEGRVLRKLAKRKVDKSDGFSETGGRQIQPKKVLTKVTIFLKQGVARSSQKKLSIGLARVTPVVNGQGYECLADSCNAKAR